MKVQDGRRADRHGAWDRPESQGGSYCVATMRLSRIFSLSFLTCKTELASLPPEFREEAGTGSPRHEGGAGQGSGGPGG